MPKPSNPELPRLLLEAALGLLDERQGADFSLRELAARVDYTVTAVYRTFGGRDGLIRALRKQLSAGFSMTLGGAAGSPTERLLEIGRRYLRWALKHPERYRLLFRPTDDDVGAPHPVGPAFTVISVTFARMAAGTPAGNSAGAPAGTIHHAQARLLLASLHGMASLVHGKHFVDDRLDAAGIIRQWEGAATLWLQALAALGAVPISPRPLQ